MRVRRCTILMLEPRERIQFDLGSVTDGGNGVVPVLTWIALAPHLGAEVVVSASQVGILGAVSPTQWTSLDELAGRFERSCVEELLDRELLVMEASPGDVRDRQLRNLRWRPASAIMHYTSRWHQVDTNQATGQQQESTGTASLLANLGPAPAAIREWVDASVRIPLPRVLPSDFDGLLKRRVTCRNFDRQRTLACEDFSSTMFRAFGAQAMHAHAPELSILKKGSPSAGGLHPIEAYVVVQHVAGIAPGLYHYHPVDHALEPMRAMERDATNALLREFVAGQAHFVDAHAVVVPTSRFARSAWKYRNHAKAYRALVLDVGHLSQTLYLAATERRLGAFVTAAINEVDIEQAFGLDPLEEGPLAVCGFGVRAAVCDEAEFDPLNAVWPAS